MADTRKFNTTTISAIEIGTEIELFLRSTKKLMSEGIETESGYFVQAKGKDSWKTIAGMDLATQVQCTQLEDGVMVEVGSGKWTDKIGAGAVGLVLFAPLAVTAAVGAWGQKKIPDEIFDHVNKFILGGGVSLISDTGIPTGQGLGGGGEFAGSKVVSGTPSNKCPQCGTIVKEGTKFCANCGSPLSKKCPSCGVELGLNAKFCPECGTSLSKKKICENCGADLEDVAKFCPECGTSCE